MKKEILQSIEQLENWNHLEQYEIVQLDNYLKKILFHLENRKMQVWLKINLVEISKELAEKNWVSVTWINSTYKFYTDWKAIYDSDNDLRWYLIHTTL